MSKLDSAAAVRHQPVAWGGDLRSARLRSTPPPEMRRASETRLQAVVVPHETREDDRDPYADVPCTD